MVDTTTAPAHAPAPGPMPASQARAEPEPQSGVGPRPVWLWTGTALVIAIGVALRCWTPVALWLDEALSVNIARLPLGSIPEALRHDGSPPLYYFLLHGWMRLFGSGDAAVRALSGVLSIATLVPMWFAGRRVANRTTAWAAVVLLAASPFAIRFATEARMYSLVMLECVLGYLALRRALERPDWKRLAPVALLTGLLLLSHYWTMYLLVLVALLLAVRALRGADPVPAKRALAAMVAGSVLFLPWVPSFLFQLRHTGTPWARRPSFEAVVGVLQEFGGGRGAFASISSLFLILLACLGLFARSLDARRLEVDVRTRPRGRALALAAVGPVVIGVLVGILTGAAFAARYAAMAVPPFVLLAALGADALSDPKVRRWVLAVVAVLGLWTGASTSFHRRTTARQVSTAIKERGSPGDVVAYCPDQLGPSVSRYVPDQFVQMTFPRGHGPERVEWVDYAETNRDAEARLFAEMVLERAGPNDVWMVWSPGYRTLGSKCEAIIEALEVERPQASRLVRVQLRYLEHPGLVRFRPGSLTSGGPREPLVIPTPSSPR
ncbi:MAG TPA: glycosyltransferase family 39 protein [Acidimicrobiales bacterium]|nr:glycosyltransferase family 39 protein [Acidimicrobiales bacterium]